MSNALEKLIEEEEKQLKQLNGEEVNEQADEDVEVGEDGEGESSGGDEGDEGATDEGKQEGDGKTPSDGEKGNDEEEVKPVDAKGWYKLRQQKREAQREADELRARIAALEAEKTKPSQPEVKQAVDPEPSRENREEWLEWKLRQTESRLEEVASWKQKQEADARQANLYSSAVKELEGYVNEFKNQVSDFDAVSDHLTVSVKNSIRGLNPHYSPADIEREAANFIIRQAAIAASKNLNPAEELYSMAITHYGYKAKEEANEPAKVRPELSKISKNKQRSATPLQSGRSGSVSATLESVADMSLAEFSRLSESQLRDLEGSY